VGRYPGNGVPIVQFWVGAWRAVRQRPGSWMGASSTATSQPGVYEFADDKRQRD
jgi:hypothetical protein